MPLDNLLPHKEPNLGYPIKGIDQDLPIELLSWEKFEKLCLALVETTYSVDDSESYGVKGQAQGGIDIFARKGTNKYATFQCKRYQEYTVSRLEQAVKKFKEGKWFSKSDEFILCTSCALNKTDLQDKFIDLRDALDQEGIKFKKWDKIQLLRLLKDYPIIVVEFFGMDWAKAFIGEDILVPSISVHCDVPAESKIEEGFRKVSLALESADYDIPDIGFIERLETPVIVEWIKKPLQQRDDALLILEGGAGLGKTAILREALVNLRILNIPVLALKADRLFAPSYQELQNKLSELSHLKSILSCIRGLSLKGDSTVVILIDQLDALSQSLSTNRRLLISYRELTQDLMSINGVRVIISCRTFDLETDPLLQSYRGKKRIKVQELDDEQVKGAIAKSSFSDAYVSPELLRLLRIPLHLRIFCQLGATTDVSGITTLQHLYDKLYEQKVLYPDHTNDNYHLRPNQLTKLLDEVARTMYEKQQLTVPVIKFQNKFTAELQYLFSQNLLDKTGHGRQLQFFHQSFFDYIFARNFVENQDSLPTLLKHTHQGLFIRSAVSQVLTYLREYDSKLYLQDVKQILCNKEDYRYHIRLLVCQQLGQISTPSAAEKQFVKLEVFNSPVYHDPFLESMRSRGWLEWLCKQGHVLVLLQKDVQLNRSEDSVLWYLAHHAPDLILNQLSQAAFNDINKHRVASLLHMSSFSADPAYDEVYDKFKDWIIINASYNFYHMLPARAQVSPEWAATVLFNILKDERSNKQTLLGNDEHSIKESLEKLLDSHVDIGFKLIKRLIEHWIDETRYDKTPELVTIYGNTAYVGDSEFNHHDPSESYCHCLTQEVYNILYNFLSKYSQQDPSSTRLLLDSWPQSTMRTLIKLSAATFYANPEAFVTDIFKLLTRPSLLKESRINSYHHYYLRSLINSTYTFFDSSQRIELHNCILDTLYVKSWYKNLDQYTTADEPKKILRTFYGELAYSYLTSIPDIEKADDSRIRILYKELYRRFDIVKYEVGRRVRWVSGDPSPIASNQATFLKPTDWLNAFRKHQATSGIRVFDNTESGLANTFKEQVKLDSVKFMPLLELLLDDANTDLSVIYIEHGLEGFSESEENFDRDKFEALVLEGINKGKIKNNNHIGIRLLRSCIKDGKCHEQVVDLLSDAVARHLHDDTPVSSNSTDELTDGINCVGGMASMALIYCYKVSSKVSTIVSTLQLVAAYGSSAVRAATLYRLAFLELPQTPTPLIKIIIDLIGKNYRLLKASEWSLRYLIKDNFDALVPLFREAIGEPVSHEPVSRVLVLAWVREDLNAYKELQSYWEKSSASRVASLKYVIGAYSELSIEQKFKARTMFNDLLAYDDQDLRQAYSFCFHKISPQDFSEWIPLLNRYVKTSVSGGREGSFYNYLQMCVQEFPAECIELASYFNRHEAPNLQRNDLGNKPLELLFSAYQVLSEIDPDSKILDTAMDVLDQMLHHATYRVGVAQKLELIDRY